MKSPSTPSPSCAVFAVLAGLLYLVNPFAAGFLLPIASVPSVASDLGAQGQPLAWLFNGADVLSGLCNLLSCGLLLAARRQGSSRWGLAAIVALMVEAGSAILAALLPLPAHGGGALHSEVYYFDGFGLVMSVWLLTLHKAGRGRRRLLVTAGVVTLTSLGCLFLQDERAFGVAQRFLILETALWIGAFPFLRPAD